MQQQYFYIYTNLETETWITQTGKDVNPVPAELFTAYHAQDGSLEVVNCSSQDLGGALVTYKPVIPAAPPGTVWAYAEFSGILRIPASDLPNLGRLELDDKICILAAPTSTANIANIVNGSSQVNLSTGQFQIDTYPPGWTNTGYKPSLLADTDIPFSFKYTWTLKDYSFLSAQFGSDDPFLIPTSMQHLPLNQSHWQDRVNALQLQTEVFKPGSVKIFLSQLGLKLSNQPF